MTTNTAHGPQDALPPVTPLVGAAPRSRQGARNIALHASRSGPEGRYLAGPGRPVYRRITDLIVRRTAAAARDEEARRGQDRAEKSEARRKENHRGGEHSWLLRLLIGIAILAEAGTAYVAMEALVPSAKLAIGLAALAALIGAGLACLLANRRLNHLPVPRSARLLEAIFVLVVTVLRFESLQIQAAGMLVAVGAAALAAIISGLALLGIEEIVVETCTFAMFCSRVRASWKRWRRAVAAGHLAGIRAAIEAASGKLEQHFLEFLLKTEGLPLDEARRRAAALRTALTSPEA